MQLVVYPAFALVGDAEWPDYHRRHQQGIARAVLLPWLVQGVSTVALLLSGLTLPTVALSVLAAATVVLTVAGAVPAHTRLGVDRTPETLRALLRANLWRTLAWSAAVPIAAIGLTT